MADHATQLAYQRRAAAVLDFILDVADAGDPLPAVQWCVAAQGCRVTGTLTQPDEGVRRVAFDAWAEALGATVTEVRSGECVVLTGTARLPEDDLVEVTIQTRVPGYGSSEKKPHG